jgi:hypothetical protein
MMMHEWIWTTGRMIADYTTEIFGEKPVPVSFSQPQISYKIPRVQTLASIM